MTAHRPRSFHSSSRLEQKKRPRGLGKATPAFSLFVFTILGLFANSLSAQDYSTEMPPLLARSARSMAMGGSFISLSSGFESLFANPAGFASAEAELCILDANPWIYVNPADISSSLSLASAFLSGASLPPSADSQASRAGLGGGFRIGTGWVGQNLGLGLYHIQDSYARGLSLPQAEGRTESDTGIVAGFALPLTLGASRLKIGGDIRPSYRVSGLISPESMLALLDSPGDLSPSLGLMPVKAGLSLSLDLGLLWEAGSFKVGVAARNLSQHFGFVDTSLGSVIGGLSSASLPGFSGSAGLPGIWTLPLLFLGASYNFSPRGISWMRDPILSLELQDPLRVFMRGSSALDMVHVGAEIRLFSFLIVRAGMNKGLFSGGFGLDLAAVEFDAAFFSENPGLYPGDGPRTGLSLEARVKIDRKPTSKQRGDE